MRAWFVKKPIRELSEEELQNLEQELVSIYMSVGDVLFMHNHCAHKSGINER